MYISYLTAMGFIIHSSTCTCVYKYILCLLVYNQYWPWWWQYAIHSYRLVHV